jgi:hypothetical protein
MTWRRNFEVDCEYGEPKLDVGAAIGVGERLGGPSGKNDDDEDAGELDGKDEYGCNAGTGVETPSALASFASLWGARGAFGGPHAGGDAVADEGRDSDSLAGVRLDIRSAVGTRRQILFVVLLVQIVAVTSSLYIEAN